MGYIVTKGDEVIWSPSQEVGRLFSEQIQALERVVGMPSGVSIDTADSMEVDPWLLTQFTGAALDYLAKTKNTRLMAMASGCVEIAIALNAAMTGCWPEVPQPLDGLLARSRKVMGAIEDYLLVCGPC